MQDWDRYTISLSCVGWIFISSVNNCSINLISLIIKILFSVRPSIIWSIKSIESIYRMRCCFFLLKMRHYFPTSFVFEKYDPEHKNFNRYRKNNKMSDNCSSYFCKKIFWESLMEPLRFFELPVKCKTTS